MCDDTIYSSSCGWLYNVDFEDSIWLASIVPHRLLASIKEYFLDRGEDHRDTIDNDFFYFAYHTETM